MKYSVRLAPLQDAEETVGQSEPIMATAWLYQLVSSPNCRYNSDYRDGSNDERLSGAKVIQLTKHDTRCHIVTEKKKLSEQMICKVGF
jgi:hypothetical protein